MPRGFEGQDKRKVNAKGRHKLRIIGCSSMQGSTIVILDHLPLMHVPGKAKRALGLGCKALMAASDKETREGRAGRKTPTPFLGPHPGVCPATLWLRMMESRDTQSCSPDWTPWGTPASPNMQGGYLWTWSAASSQSSQK